MKDFINEFDINKPDWSTLPEGFFELDPESLNTQDMIKYNSIKVLWEMYKPAQSQSRSRVWKSPNGYIYLASWSNASLLRFLGVRWIHWLKDAKGNYRSLNSSNILQNPAHPTELQRSGINSFGWKYIERLEAQLLDCLRSSVANQEEGYARATTSEYLDFLGYSQGSLKEAKGDFQRSKQDGFLPSKPGSSLASIGIDLRAWHEALKKSIISKPVDYPTSSSGLRGANRNLQDVKGSYKPSPNSSNILQSPANSFNYSSSSNVLQAPVNSFNYLPVDNLDPDSLTFEIFIELVNKTDWQLRRLVESLEMKLNQDQKFYKVERARVEEKFRKR